MCGLPFFVSLPLRRPATRVTAMQYAHQFRDDNGVHVVLSIRSKMRRGRTLAMCAAPFDANSQRIAPHSDPFRSVPITCPRCSRAFDGFIACIDTDFGWPTPDRFA